jgi:hypothetical protein
MDFDTTARRIVISHAIFGAALGGVPGAVMLFIPDIASPQFARDLLAFGCLIGSQAGAIAALAGLTSAGLRNVRRAFNRNFGEPHMDRAFLPSTASGIERRATAGSSTDHEPLAAGSAAVTPR